MEEEYISLEAVNAFEDWLQELPEKISDISDLEYAGYRLRELAEEYEVEDISEMIYLLRQWLSSLDKEFIPGTKRALVLRGFNIVP